MARCSVVFSGKAVPTSREGHEAQRVVWGDRDRARCLRPGAKLIVIARTESSGIVHALTAKARHECDNR
jgi:hypothetical protein